jgi:hypothetical protein
VKLTGIMSTRVLYVMCLRNVKPDHCAVVMNVLYGLKDCSVYVQDKHYALYPEHHLRIVLISSRLKPPYDSGQVHHIG